MLILLDEPLACLKGGCHGSMPGSLVSRVFGLRARPCPFYMQFYKYSLPFTGLRIWDLQMELRMAEKNAPIDLLPLCLCHGHFLFLKSPPCSARACPSSPVPHHLFQSPQGNASGVSFPKSLVTLTRVCPHPGFTCLSFSVEMCQNRAHG